MTNKYPVSWDRIDELSRKLAQTWTGAPGQYTNGYPLRAIVGISRGGLIPTAILSNLLQIRQPNIGFVHAKSYIDTKQKHAAEIHMDAATEDLLKCRDTLVIDDIYDTGATYHALHKTFPNPTYAALYRRTTSPDLPGLIWMANVTSNAWLVFPWE